MGVTPIFCLKRRKMDSDPLGIQSLVEPVVVAMGYELWGLECRAGKMNAFVRVYIDRAGGVNVDDCARVSHQLSGLLDVEDPISVPYALEVSSPGIDRPLFCLRHFEQVKGQQVRVSLMWKVQNRKNVVGVLESVDEENIQVVSQEGTHTIPYQAIKKANLIGKTTIVKR